MTLSPRRMVSGAVSPAPEAATARRPKGTTIGGPAGETPCVNNRFRGMLTRHPPAHRRAPALPTSGMLTPQERFEPTTQAPDSDPTARSAHVVPRPSRLSVPMRTVAGTADQAATLRSTTHLHVRLRGHDPRKRAQGRIESTYPPSTRRAPPVVADANEEDR